MWSTIRTRPLRSAISISSSHSAEEAAIGFSMKVCLPASRARLRQAVVMLDRRGNDDGVQLRRVQEFLKIRDALDSGIK